MLIFENILGLNIRKLIFSFLLVGITAFTFASIGEGSNKSKNDLRSSVIPLRVSRNLSLKSGFSYKGSIVVKEDRTLNSFSFHSLGIYQKGNVTYILPNKYRISVAADNHQSSLQLLKLRIKLCK